MTRNFYDFSCPTTEAAKAYGIPYAIAVNYGWGIILNARDQEQTGWTQAAAAAVNMLLDFHMQIAFHDALLAAYIKHGTVPPQEMPR